MNATTPRKIAQTLPYFTSLFHPSRGVKKIGFLNLWTTSRSGFSVKKMAWSLEKSDGNVETKLVSVSPATEDYAEEAIEAIKAGKVIAVPTDTLYGFACDACSAEAVNRIYEIKRT
ncbi:PREDICTED: uncharacterized protein LOC109205931 [Nicotiana attenuata]|uniref:uncharacterized protein LOC109205931 n=1 Tax=Nicotiana attenuata TaxID=49451 RepID=UPI00090510D2|nr:PREDICTED: uncharacterized protein LOC109205931 [Nicotiana attenuata]